MRLGVELAGRESHLLRCVDLAPKAQAAARRRGEVYEVEGRGVTDGRVRKLVGAVVDRVGTVWKSNVQRVGVAAWIVLLSERKRQSPLSWVAPVPVWE